MSLDQMKSIVRDQMKIIDEILAKRGTALNQRIFDAAIFFVSECIIEIKGDTKDDFWGKKWFSDIYHWTEDWYRERYGDALEDRERNQTIGVVRVYSTPFSLSIPLTLTKPEDPGKTAWLIFPITVMSDENPYEWIHPKPNLEQLTREDLESLKKEIDFVASSLRSINVNLMTAEYSASSLQMLGGSITAHLEKAVQDILSGKLEQISVAYWEIHLAIEKTIKLFLRQKGHTPPNTHNLIELRGIAENDLSSTELDDSFSKCPKAKEAIGYRYGENQDVSSENAIEFYYASLRIISFYTKALHRDIVMNNARILIKIPPWNETNT
jgi:HEPN domain-containing protein